MGKTRAKQDSARRLAVQAARIAHDRNCSDIVVLDLGGISPVTDYFVIFTGTSDRQMRAVADEIVHEAAASGQRPFNVAGLGSSTWILLDFVDVVVHIFDDEHRGHYDLELIWGDAARVRWRRPASLRRAGGPQTGVSKRSKGDGDDA